MLIQVMKSKLPLWINSVTLCKHRNKDCTRSVSSQNQCQQFVISDFHFLSNLPSCTNHFSNQEIAIKRTIKLICEVVLSPFSPRILIFLSPFYPIYLPYISKVLNVQVLHQILSVCEIFSFTFAKILIENALMLLGKSTRGPCGVDIHNEQVDESRQNMAYNECWKLCHTRNLYSLYNWYSTYMIEKTPKPSTH